MDLCKRWYANKRFIALHSWIALFLITSSTTGYDSSMMNGLQSLTQWQVAFNHPSGGNLGLLNAIQNVGTLAAYPFAPHLSDSLGRRRALWIGAAIMCVGTAIQTASQSISMFLGARFLIGVGNTFASNAAPMLITELSYPTYRAPLTSFYNALLYLGTIVAAWTTFGSFRINDAWAWRLPSLLQAAPSVIQVALVLFAPESPRWLASKGREVEALRTLSYYHADGNEHDPLVQFEFSEIKAALELESANVGWKSFFVTAGNRKRLTMIVAIAFFTQWSGSGLIAYYLPQVLIQIGVTNPSTQLLINAVLQLWNFFSAVFASSSVDRLGRRPLVLTSMALMLVFYIGQTVCVATYVRDGKGADAVIVFIFLFYAAYNCAFTPLAVVYPVEILSSGLRAKGLSVFYCVASLGAMFNQYVNPIALEKLGWKYYLVYVCWLVCEFVFLWFFLVETRNRTLEETAVLFDGEDAINEIAKRVEGEVSGKKT